jgi:hypothetical protein
MLSQHHFFCWRDVVLKATGSKWRQKKAPQLHDVTTRLGSARLHGKFPSIVPKARYRCCFYGVPLKLFYIVCSTQNVGSGTLPLTMICALAP